MPTWFSSRGLQSTSNASLRTSLMTQATLMSPSFLVPLPLIAIICTPAMAMIGLGPPTEWGLVDLWVTSSDSGAWQGQTDGWMNKWMNEFTSIHERPCDFSVSTKVKSTIWFPSSSWHWNCCHQSHYYCYVANMWTLGSHLRSPLMWHDLSFLFGFMTLFTVGFLSLETLFFFGSVQSLSHIQLFATPLPAECQASLSITNSWSLLKLMSIELVMPSNHLILCRPLLLLPSIFPIIRVFSKESVLHIRWPKDWSFSFSISPSNEHSGLISFKMDWLDLLAVQGTLKSLLQYHSSKASILWCSAFFIVQLLHPYMTTGKTIALTRWTFVTK